MKYLVSDEDEHAKSAVFKVIKALSVPNRPAAIELTASELAAFIDPKRVVRVKDVWDMQT